VAKITKNTPNLEYLKELLQLMQDYELAELEIEETGKKIKLKKTQEQKITYSAPPTIGGNLPLLPTLDLKTPRNASPEGLEEIKSPMVGTFYRSPGPGKPSFVEKGDEIKQGDILCIVEAMKIMNDIKSTKSGKIVDILVENGEAVEFGQPLFTLQVKS
jgi:acetyl-CoA carboxylase biotin carboxyl carrier protein